MAKDADAVRREVSLPDEQTELLHVVGEFLADDLPLQDCALGGGTALAARWKHRASVDIDVFGESDVFERAFSALCERAEEWAAAGRIAEFRPFHASVLHAKLTSGGEFSVGGRFGVTSQPLSHETEATTRIPLHSTQEIIYRKIRGRMAANTSYLIRDAYDVVTCHFRDPFALTLALDRLTPIDKSYLSYDANNPQLVLDQSKPLLCPRYPSLRDPTALQRMLFTAMVGTAAEREALRTELARRYDAGAEGADR